jgi:hypothetical protein
MKMQIKWMIALWALVLAALIPAAVHAQTDAAQPQTTAAHAQPPAAHALTDVAGSFYETFTTKTVTGGGITQTSANSEGGLLELRHIQSPWIGYELAYSFNRDNQTLAPVPGACAYFCRNVPETLGVMNHEFSLDWIVSRQYGNLRPFLVGGVGFTLAIPLAVPGTYVMNSTKPTYIGGAGVDWGFGSKLGLRLQYRENILTAPHLDPRFPSTGGFTPIGEPMVGVYYRLSGL